MRIVTAVLIKRRSADGLIEVGDHVQLGREYRIDLDSRRKQSMFNLEHKRPHEKEIVNAENGRWLPMELLEVRSECELSLS